MAEPTSQLIMIKTCRYCGIEKSLTEFYNSKNREQYGKKNMCKTCSRKKYKKWRQSIDTKTYDHVMHIKCNYGLPKEKYDQMLKQQNGVCAICGEPETKAMKNGEVYRLSVDHCHTTDKVRALLCCKCNAILGLAHDDTMLLAGCIQYVEKFYE